MDMDYPIDLDEVLNVVRTSDVIIVRFSTVGKRLLLDFRVYPNERPVICLVNRSRSAEDRFRELQKLRPGVALPDQIMSFHWPKYVAALEQLGVLDRIIEKFGASGYSDMEQDCRKIYQELRVLEQGELMAAIKGEGYQALWEKKRA